VTYQQENCVQHIDTCPTRSAVLRLLIVEAQTTNAAWTLILCICLL